MFPGETILSGASPVCPDCQKKLEFQVLKSAAGYYIGTACCCGPYTRETEYYPYVRSAEADLADGTWKNYARK
jgi:hypothetical protein